MPIKDILKKLDELREKATQGEWVHDNGSPAIYGDDCYATIGTIKHRGEIVSGDYETGICMSSSDAQYIVALHNSYQSLRKAALAGEALAKAVEANNCCHITREYCGCLTKRDAALATYRKAIEE